MYRIDNSTAVQARPTIPPPATPGYFTNGNPTLASPATIVDDWWLNQLQDEIIAVISYAGITLNKTNTHQLLDALNTLYTGAGATGNYLPLIGGTLRRPGGGENILSITTEPNRPNMILFQVDGQHQFGIGVGGGGSVLIQDVTTGHNCFSIGQSDHNVNVNSGDLGLFRNDQPTAWIRRGAGTGLGIGASAGGNIGEFLIYANNTRALGHVDAYRFNGYLPGQSDPLFLRSDGGHNCIAHFQTGGSHEFGVGVGSGGDFYLPFDYTDNRASMFVRPNGTVRASGRLECLDFQSDMNVNVPNGFVYGGNRLETSGYLQVGGPAYLSQRLRVDQAIDFQLTGGYIDCTNGNAKFAHLTGYGDGGIRVDNGLVVQAAGGQQDSLWCFGGCELLWGDLRCTNRNNVMGGTGWFRNLNAQNQYASGGIMIYGDDNSGIRPTDNRYSNGIGGQAWSQVTSYWFNDISDERLKQDIEVEPAGALDRVMALHPVQYHWRKSEPGDEPLKRAVSDATNEPLHHGFLAQQVRQVMGDNFGGWREDNGVQGLNYHELVAVLWQAVQELNGELATLRKESVHG